MLEGRAGIVTGAASGIGAAIVEELTAAGAHVLVADTRIEGLPERESVSAVRADVRRFEDVCHAVERCRRAHGGVDFLVANAGIVDSGSMLAGDPERWRRVIETNLLGVANSVRAVLPVMAEARSGHIAVLASWSGRVAYAGEPIYAASKWGAVGLARALRLEAHEHGVRVTIVEPGLVDTPMIRATPEGQAELRANDALDPTDVARAVAFCLTQPARVNVTEIVVQPLHQDI